MRHIIYGAGGVGATIGGRLFHSGQDVVLICRGEHLRAIQERGLRLLTPEQSLELPIPAVGHPSEIEFTADDVVIMAMKTQDTEGALEDLEAAVGEVEPAIVCAQNGVENERRALRRFARVYGMVTRLPGTFLEPGVVENHATPVGGLLDLGRYPQGSDALAEQISADLRAAGFNSRTESNVMRWKYAKLIRNLNNGLTACLGSEVDDDLSAFGRTLIDEALACYGAAGFDFATEEEEAAHRAADGFKLGRVPGSSRQGNSTWQSLVRGTGSIETDFLNGEIVMLGREHGVPTPYNHAVQRASAWMAREAKQPGALTLADLERMVEQERAAAVP